MAKNIRLKELRVIQTTAGIGMSYFGSEKNMTMAEPHRIQPMVPMLAAVPYGTFRVAGQTNVGLNFINGLRMQNDDNAVFFIHEKGELRTYAFTWGHDAYQAGLDFEYFHGRNPTTRTENLGEIQLLDKTLEGFNKVKHRFKKISELKAGWDTYGAKPIKKETIQKASEFFVKVVFGAALDNNDIPLPFITPLEDGNIFFEWRTCFKEIFITVPEDKQEAYTYLKVDKILNKKFEGEKADLNDLVNLAIDWLI